ncbi:MAG: Oxygen-independent coproporphyrinogen-III oxidase 2 [Firmicutes bacterium ADurb.Bin248]|nr:MAG: Oxygen-independent coproporphyrinogen-III oxidase 2 [Firmicutes bacterium ADurb.Bin248]HPK15511.1 coproporphyrinogen dehydrogenase HemZ [Clostridia bacterium]
MVRLYTDHPVYANDIADEARLFAGREEIVPSDGEDCDISITLTEQNGFWRATAKADLNGKHAEYTLERPAYSGEALEVKRREKRAMKIAAFRALRAIYGFTPPWGSLTGIRPTRLLRELIEREGEAEALNMMAEDFDVSADKLALARGIVEVQSPMLAGLSDSVADVYVNIPFCPTKCSYCSFPSKVRTAGDDMDAYLSALERDIELGAALLRDSARSVRALYIGGGTPTVLDARELARLFDALRRHYGNFGGEFTLEAGRPDSITKEKLAVLRAYGVTRVSVNPQSMNAKTLALVGRSHTPGDVERAFALAREAGFDNINMDVIAGLPGEDAKDMEYTLERIARLSPESLTVHTLALKRASLLVTDGEAFPLPEAALAAEMLRLGAAFARGLGMRPYYMYRQKFMRGNLENVGYAKPGSECVYNVDMMEDAASILAHGAGGMTKRVFDAQRRVERVPAPKDIEAYAAKVEALAAEKRSLFLDFN